MKTLSVCLLLFLQFNLEHYLLHYLTLHVLFVVLSVFHCLPAAVSPYPHGNHLTLTLSGDHIDFLVGVIAIKTPT